MRKSWLKITRNLQMYRINKLRQFTYNIIYCCAYKEN